MKTGKTEMEHMSDGVLQVYDKLLHRFMAQSKTLKNMKDNEYLNGLAKSIGFMAQTNAAISKSYKQEKRLKAIEEKLKNSQLSTNMRMFEEPQLEKYR